MPSPEKPAPDRSDQILALTLAAVRQRRVRRRRVTSAGLMLVAMIAAAIVWNPYPFASVPSGQIAGPEPTTAPNAAAPEARPTPENTDVVIERIPQRPLESVIRIDAAATARITERIEEDAATGSTITRISDEQLLAELATGQPAGLLYAPDGSVQLLFR